MVLFFLRDGKSGRVLFPFLEYEGRSFSDDCNGWPHYVHRHSPTPENRRRVAFQGLFFVWHYVFPNFRLCSRASKNLFCEKPPVLQN